MIIVSSKIREKNKERNLNIFEFFECLFVCVFVCVSVDFINIVCRVVLRCLFACAFEHTSCRSVSQVWEMDTGPDGRS
jgi:hypothetical protein